MGLPAASGASQVVAVDIHVVLVPSPGGPVPTPLPHPFAGTLDGSLVTSVTIAGQPAAVVGSTATNAPAHVPLGSASVRIGGQPAARSADPVTTCNDPADAPVGQVVATGTVLIG